MQFLLQRSLLPDHDFAEPLLYVREAGAVQRGDQSAEVGAGGVLSFDTSFGVFHAGRWRRLTTVDRLAVRVVATGVGRAEVVAVTRGREQVIASAELTNEPIDLPVGSLQAATWGVLYVRIVATGTRMWRAGTTCGSVCRSPRLTARPT